MALVVDLTSAISALSASIDALIAKKGSGIQPADLDPVLQAINDAKTKVDAAVAAP